MMSLRFRGSRLGCCFLRLGGGLSFRLVSVYRFLLGVWMLRFVFASGIPYLDTRSSCLRISCRIRFGL